MLCSVPSSFFKAGYRSINFLDIDNLESIDELEAYVKASAMLLVLLGSPKYFCSANCLRELRAAKAHELQDVELYTLRWDLTALKTLLIALRARELLP